jgi:hypothetical protein
VHCRRIQERRGRERLLAQTDRVRNQQLFSATASNTGRKGEEREKRTDKSPMEGEAGGEGRGGGEIEDGVHSRISPLALRSVVGSSTSRCLGLLVRECAWVSFLFKFEMKSIKMI